MTKKEMVGILLEEITKDELEKSITKNNEKLVKSQDFKNAVKDEFDNYIKKRDFEDRIEDMARNLMDKFFERMWSRKSFFRDCLGK